MDSFKKLFVVEFNRKNFLILVGEDHHFAFLEVNKEGKYSYPKYEDYKALDEIYNHFDWTKVPSFTKVEFRNVFRRAMSAFMSSVISINFGLALAAVVQDFASDKGYVITAESPTLLVKKVGDRENLEIYYGNEKITRDDVIRAINNNDSYNDSYKRAAIKAMDENLKCDPDAGLRIYYENMQITNLAFISEEKMSDNGKLNRRAYVDPSKHTIYLIKGVDEEVTEDNELFILHEFNHLFHLLWDSENSVYFNESSPLHEGMTSMIIGSDSYWFEQQVLRYFMANVDKFNFHTYNEHGLVLLIDELKEKYPNVDIDWILDEVKANFISNQSKEIKKEKEHPLDNADFVDEMFKIALSNIDKDDKFRAFESFASFLGVYDYNCWNAILNDVHGDNPLDKYFSLYVNELENRGLISPDRVKGILNLIEKLSFVVNANGKLYIADEAADLLDNSDGDYYVDSTLLGYKYNSFAMNGKFKFTCFDDYGNRKEVNVNDDMIQYIFVDDFAKIRLANYIADGEFRANSTLEEILNSFNEKNDLFGVKKYMTFSNGEVAMSEITDDMYVLVGYNTDGDIGLMLYQQDKLIYGTCDGLVSPTAKIPFSKYVKLVNTLNSRDFNSLDDIISKDGLNSIPGYILNYYMPNIDIDYVERELTDAQGQKHYFYNRTYNFREPFKTYVDGEELSLGAIELYAEFFPDKRPLVLHIAQDKEIEIGDIYKDNYSYVINYEEDGSAYAAEMSEILDYFGIEPENGIYNFTTDDLVRIVKNYLEEQDKLLLGKIENTNIKR